MDFMTALDVAASGMSAQRSYINVISMNLANIKTTRTEEGGAYVRKSVSFESAPVLSPFDERMRESLPRQVQGVLVRGIVNDQRPFKRIHEPGHPDADGQGYVTYPDINVVEEMANMMTTMRTYEANAKSIEAVKSMFNKALTIGQ